MKKVLIISTLVVLSVFLLAPREVHAKRLLPRAKPSAGAQVVRTSSTRGVTASVKFRGDRRAIIVTFGNPEVASRVEYSLIYTSSGVPQGAGGTLTGSGSQVRELLFGTCSSGVCRYHTGITGAKLTITTTLKNGRKVLKPFRLRV